MVFATWAPLQAADVKTTSCVADDTIIVSMTVFLQWYKIVVLPYSLDVLVTVYNHEIITQMCCDMVYIQLGHR